MKIAFVSPYSEVVIKDTNILPRLGDKVDMFFEPAPSVSQVLLFPSLSNLSRQSLPSDTDAIISVR